jgi:DNA-binding IclR family transcriptional regulator
MVENRTETLKQTTLHSLSIIEALKRLDSATFAEVADAVGLANSTTYDHLETLRSEGYVVKEGERYRLGLQFLHVGGRVVNRIPAFRMLTARVRDLAQSTGERTQFIVEENGRGFYVITDAESETAVHTDVHLGKWCHLHSTAAGKVILANLPRERVEAIVDEHGLEAKTPHTITSKAELFESLEAVRERGYAFNKGERIEKQWAVGVPVIGPHDRAVGGLSISGPENRMKGEPITETFPSQLLGVANEIELKLAHPGFE